MKATSWALLLLITGTMFVALGVPQAPKAKATVPNPTGIESCGSYGYTIPLPVSAAGDVIIIGLINDYGSGNTPPYRIATAHDTFGSSFTVKGYTYNYDAAITTMLSISTAYALSAGSGIDSITITNTPSYGGTTCLIGFDVKGILSNMVFAGSNNSFTSTGIGTNSNFLSISSAWWTPNPPASNQTIVDFVDCQCNTAVANVAAGGSYSLANLTAGAAASWQGFGQASAEGNWESDLTPFPGNEAPFHLHFYGPGAFMGMAFSFDPPIPTPVIKTVIQVIPCNFTELQCWWEPLIFYGMYIGLWIGVGASMQVRARSLTYLFGASVSYASLYLVLLGELPYPFAIMAFLGAVAYGLRLDGVF